VTSERVIDRENLVCAMNVGWNYVVTYDHPSCIDPLLLSPVHERFCPITTIVVLKFLRTFSRAFARRKKPLRERRRLRSRENAGAF
jgi:hypothetical protein